MQYRTIVVGSNDVGFKDIERLEQIGLHAADGELGFSGGIVRRIHSENVGIDLVPLESVLQRITTRLSYGLRVDGIVNEDFLARNIPEYSLMSSSIISSEFEDFVFVNGLSSISSFFETLATGRQPKLFAVLSLRSMKTIWVRHRTCL